MKLVVLSLCWAVALGAQPALGEAPAGSSAAAEVPAKLFKRCYGGLEDGKVIVREDELTDEASQTTHRRCRIDGGSAQRAPRSPSIAASRVLVV